MWEFSLLAPVGSRVTAEQKQYSSEVWPERQAAEIAQSGLAENPQTSAVCQLCLPLEPSQPPNPFAALELPAGLQFPLGDINVCTAKAHPKRRQKGRKSMKRRKGQNGTLVIQSCWHRVRFRKDVEGQEEQVNMSEKVAPVALDKYGKPKPPSQAMRRLAREIGERSGANSEEQFNRVVLGYTSFREQAKIYLRWAETRDREPIKDTSTIEATLDRWILPEIGDLPLANVNNVTVKPLVTKMKRSLSPCAVNKYVQYVKQIVASLRDAETGEPIHRRSWDSTVMDLPVVKQKEQRRPALKAKLSISLFGIAKVTSRRCMSSRAQPGCESRRPLLWRQNTSSTAAAPSVSGNRSTVTRRASCSISRQMQLTVKST
jgi:hypothetical protein